MAPLNLLLSHSFSNQVILSYGWLQIVRMVHARDHRLRTTFRITITRLLVPKEPSGRNPSSANIDSVPPQINELEYFFPWGIAIGYPSTVPPPLALMKRSAPSSAALATPSRLWSRSTKKHVVLQSGGSTSILS